MAFRSSCLLFLFVIFSNSISAQSTAQKDSSVIADAFSQKGIAAFFSEIEVKDLATVPHSWTYSFVSADKEKLSRFAGELTGKQKNKVQLGTTGANYICSIEDTQIFTAQSLYDRITYLNQVAATFGLEHMKTFGLKGENR